MRCETCLNSRTGISENGYHCVCTLSAKKAANCITNDYKHYVKSPLDIPQKPITNADCIRSMTDEELAVFIRDQIIDRNIGIPSETWLDWLREVAT